MLTPDPEIDALLDTLRAEVRAILGPRFVGMYLDGSLAAGDFDPASSDIDVIVVTAGDLPDEVIGALRAMHGRIAEGSSRWARELEVAYVARHTIRAPGRRPGPCPCIERGSAHLEVVNLEGGYWTLHRHVLRQHGVVVMGPPPATLIDPVSPGELRQAVADVLDDWWRPMRDDPTRLRAWEYRYYAVLTMCRMLYTLHHGAIVSKPVAARWVEATLDPRWIPLIRDARAWSAAAPPDLTATLGLIRHTHARSR